MPNTQSEHRMYVNTIQHRSGHLFHLHLFRLNDGPTAFSRRLLATTVLRHHDQRAGLQRALGIHDSPGRRRRRSKPRRSAAHAHVRTTR
jgi:hypothetical protein